MSLAFWLNIKCAFSGQEPFVAFASFSRACSAISILLREFIEVTVPV